MRVRIAARRAELDRREVVRSLARSPAFGSCSADDLDAFVRASRLFTAPARWPLFAEGTPADCIYWIEHGSVTAFRGRRPVAAFGPGRVIDDPAVLTGRPRHIAVTSTTPLAGLRLPSEALVDLITRHPALLDGLLPDPDRDTRSATPPDSAPEPIRWRPPPARTEHVPPPEPTSAPIRWRPPPAAT